jgi:hypothetical protein
VRQDLHSWFKRLDRNNVAAFKSRPRVETATMFSHIFHECMFMQKMPSSINPSDFNRDIYREAFFPSFLAFERAGQCARVLTQ